MDDHNHSEKLADDVKAWLTIALIDVAATVVVGCLFVWLSGASS